MKGRVVPALLVAATAAFLGGCSAFEKHWSPASATAPPLIDSFVGTWTAETSSATSTQCSKLGYTISKTGPNVASVAYDLTCNGISANGTGNGTVMGTSFTWSMSSILAGEGIPPNCLLSFTNNTATLQGADAIQANYSGVVCGTRVSGSEILRKK